MTSALAEEEGSEAADPAPDGRASGAGAGDARRPVNAPSVTLLLAEPLRAVAELVHASAGGGLLRRVRRGDGRGVMVLPGLGAGDYTTVLMRRLLMGLGYHVEGWELGRNLGPTAAVMEALPR